jgi:hypothetical protein
MKRQVIQILMFENLKYLSNCSSNELCTETKVVEFKIPHNFYVGRFQCVIAKFREESIQTGPFSFSLSCLPSLSYLPPLPCFARQAWLLARWVGIPAAHAKPSQWLAALAPAACNAPARARVAPRVASSPSAHTPRAARFLAAVCRQASPWSPSMQDSGSRRTPNPCMCEPLSPMPQFRSTNDATATWRSISDARAATRACRRCHCRSLPACGLPHSASP